MTHTVAVESVVAQAPPGSPRADNTGAIRTLRPAVKTSAITPPTQRAGGGVRAPRVARRSPVSTVSSTVALRRRAEALARQVQAHFPPQSAVVLQVGLGESGSRGGSRIVLQLIDRTTHQVYFRIPPEQAMPVVARLAVNGMGSGLFVDSRI